MERLEFKYLLPVSQLNTFRSAIRPFVDDDSFMLKTNEYHIHSIYYDSMALDCYYEKLSGIECRRKVRIRGYNEGGSDSLVFLEVKRKDNDMVSKNRAPLLYKNLGNLLITRDIDRFVRNGNGIAHDDARRFFFYMNRLAMVPMINIHYDREAYFQTGNKLIRITFDKNLRSTMFPNTGTLFIDNNACRSLEGYFVLEVKFPNYLTSPPAWIAKILRDFNLTRSAISKYAISLEEHGIPDTRSRCLCSRN